LKRLAWIPNVGPEDGSRKPLGGQGTFGTKTARARVRKGGLRTHRPGRRGSGKIVDHVLSLEDKKKHRNKGPEKDQPHRKGGIGRRKRDTYSS